MDVVDPWHRAAAALVPAETAIWDAHTHTGTSDPDGVVGHADRLIAKLGDAGQAGAVVTTSQDPGGYPAANDRILAEARGSRGRLIPFLRVDPGLGDDAVAEAVRSLAAGHRGIKLHPRGERFGLDDPTVRRLAHLAADHGVPILCHAGLGIPPLGEHAVRLCGDVDGLRLVLAHCAISDLSWLGPRAGEVPGLYFDTSWWDITDLLALMSWVPPGRILYASDTPYGHPALSFVLTARAAAAARYPDAARTALFGATLTRLLAGDDGASVPPAEGPPPAVEPGLLRLHSKLTAAIGRAFAGEDASAEVALALRACRVRPDTPHEPVYGAIARTLEAIDPAGTRRSRVVRPLLIAAAAALTPDVAVPDL